MSFLDIFLLFTAMAGIGYLGLAAGDTINEYIKSLNNVAGGIAFIGLVGMMLCGFMAMYHTIFG